MTELATVKKTNALWSLFSSVKLTIGLLIVLATASILGTFIPQQDGAVEFARSLRPGLFRFLSSLDLFDMYHSLWFRLLMGLLTLNLVICSMDRFPGTWKRFRALPRPDRNKPFENLKQGRSFVTGGEVKAASGSISRFLRSRYKKIHDQADADRHCFYVAKGRYSHFGVYMVHISVVFILIGALVGSFFGFEAYVNIPEGDGVDHVALKNGGHLELGFKVWCDRFFVDFYENGAPKEYRSELRFLVNGKEGKKSSLMVNHPTTFRGVTFYQSRYGAIPGKKVHLHTVRNGHESKNADMEVEVGKSFPLPGAEGRFQVEKVDGNLMGVLGPAAQILIKPDQGEEARFWIFQDLEMAQRLLPDKMKRSPKLNASAFPPYTFFLDELETRYYTGLQVNRDPGVAIVWAGCFLMVAGFFVTFFISHRRIWIRVEGNKTGVMIRIAGTASKNPVGLGRELEYLTNNLKNLFNEKG